MCLGCRQGRAALSLPKQLPAIWPPPNNQSYKPAPATQALLPHLQLNDAQLQHVNQSDHIDTTSKSSRFVNSFLPSIAVGSLAGAYGAISSSLINSITPSRLSGTSSPAATACFKTHNYYDSTPAQTYPIDISAATEYIQKANLIMDTDNNDVLRSVVAVFRHADRTPKQKVKMRTKYPDLLALFPTIDATAINSIKTNQHHSSSSSSINKTKNDPELAMFSEIKFAKPANYLIILNIIKRMIDKEIQRQTSPTEDDLAAMNTARLAESLYTGAEDELCDDRLDGDADKDRAMERVYMREKREREKRENEKDPDYLAKLMRVRTVLLKQYPGIKIQLKATKSSAGHVTQALLVCKWGGQMTHAGIGQARQYAAAFWDDILPPPQNPLIYTIPFQHPNHSSSNQSNPSPAPIELALHNRVYNSSTASIANATASSVLNSSSILNSPSKPAQPSTMRQREQDQIRQATINAASSDDVEVSCINSDISDDTSVAMDSNSTLHQGGRQQWLNMLSSIKSNDANNQLTADELIAANVDKQSSPDKSSSSTNSSNNTHTITSSNKLPDDRVGSISGSGTSMTTNNMYDTDTFRAKQKAFEQQRLRFITGLQLFSSDEARVVASTEAFYQSTMEYCSGIIDTDNDVTNETLARVKQITSNMSSSVHHGADVNVFLDDTSMCITAMQRAKEAVRFLLTADHLWTPGQVTSHMIMREHLDLASNEEERLEAEQEERDLLAQAKKAAEMREQRERERAEARRKKRLEEEKLELLLDQQATLEPDGNDNSEAEKNNEIQYNLSQLNIDTNTDSNDVPSYTRSSTPVHDNTRPVHNYRSLSVATPLSSPANNTSRHTSSMPRSPITVPDSPKSPPLSPGTTTANISMTQWGMRCLRWIGKPHDTLYKLYQLLVDLQTQIHKKCEFVQQYQSNARLTAAELDKQNKSLRYSALADEELISKQRAPDGQVMSMIRTSSGNIREKISANSTVENESDDESADVFEYVFDEGMHEHTYNHNDCCK